MIIPNVRITPFFHVWAEKGLFWQNMPLKVESEAEPIFDQAFLNAASEFASDGQSHLAEHTRQAMVEAKFPMFYRNDDEIRGTLSQECFKNTLELVDVHSRECLLDNKSGARMTNMMLSICENAMLASLRYWAIRITQGQLGKISYWRERNFLKNITLKDHFLLQGDHSHCSQPPVDIKTKVLF